MSVKLKEFMDVFINVLYEIRNTKKTDTSLKCKIILVYPNGLASTFYGFTDESNNVLFCPNLLRMWLNPKPVYIDGIKTFICSSKYHHTLDMDKLGKVAGAVAQKAVISFKYLRTWETLTVKNVAGTIDVNLFDNDFSSDFTHDSLIITKTKALEFLGEIPRRVWILSLIISGLFGGIIFSIATCVIIGVLLWLG